MREVGSEARVFTPKLTRRLVGTGVFTVAVYSAFLFYADLGDMRASVRSVSGSVLLGSLLLGTLNYVIRAIRWQAYLSHLGLRVPAAESAVVFTSGFAMTVTPGKMGEVLKSVLLKSSHGVPIAVTAPVVVAERVTDLAGLVLLVAIGGSSLRSGAVIGIGGALIVVALIAVCTWRPLGELVLSLAARIAFVNRASDRLREAYDSLRVLSAPGITFYAIALSTLSWATHCAALWLLAGAVAPGSIDLLESCFVYAAPLLAGTLVLLPGGLGLTEASMAGLLIGLSDDAMTMASATAVALIARLVTFWWAVLLGFLALWLWRVRYGR